MVFLSSLSLGFRRVVPYVYAFETHAKGRWYERKLLDIFKTEFRLETPEFYVSRIVLSIICNLDKNRLHLIRC